MNLDQVKGQVEWCLEKKPLTRNDDMLLVISVWKNFYRSDFIDFLLWSVKALEEEPSVWMQKGGNIKNLPSFESIRRTRQKIQNEEGKYKASPEIEDSRRKAESNVKEWALKNPGY